MSTQSSYKTQECSLKYTGSITCTQTQPPRNVGAHTPWCTDGGITCARALTNTRKNLERALVRRRT